MYTITHTAPNRLDIVLDGKLNSARMRQALDELEHHAASIEHGVMLYDLVDFHLPSLGAIMIELARLPAMLGMLKRFDRAAVLTDKAWLQTISEWEGALFPGIEIKAFDRAAREQAEAWLRSDT